MSRRQIIVSLVVTGILVAYTWFHRLGPAHLALLAVGVACARISDTTRDFLVSLFPLIAFGFVYSFMEVFEPRAAEVVSVEAIYRLEQTLFGWLTPAGGDLGPVDFFREHHYLAVDTAAGLVYATHIPASYAFAIYLWWRHHTSPSPEKRRRLDGYTWGFFAMSLVGLAIQALFPVAPPWYVEQFGFAPPGEPIPGDPAGLARVDAWLGIEYFSTVYAQASYVFGALPSLHVASPVWLALHVCHRVGRPAAWGFAASMAFSAVYLGHHYLVDVLAGAALAVGIYALLAIPTLGGFVLRLHDRLQAWLFGKPNGEQAVHADPVRRGE